jgi:uncharacterized membrane protein
MADSRTETEGQTEPTASRARAGFNQVVLVLLLATLVRLALLGANIVLHPELFHLDATSLVPEISSPELPNMNDFGWEASAIAYAWTCTDQGFASPFGADTGPTAWIAPGVVALYGAAFSLWGCFTPPSVFFVFAVALILSVVTTYVVFRIGLEISDSRAVGVIAAILFAILPLEARVFIETGHLDFNLQVFWLAILLYTALRILRRDWVSAALALGVVSSAAMYFNPGFVLCTAAAGLVWIRGRDMASSRRFLSLMATIHLIIVGPYVLYQSARLGTFVPVKSNAGFELFLGNTEEAEGILTVSVFRAHHPASNQTEFHKYRELGEEEYVRSARESFFSQFRLDTYSYYTIRRLLGYFLVFNLGSPVDSTPLALAKMAFWPLPAISLIALIVSRKGKLERTEILLPLFVLAYAFPYLVAGVNSRYRIPIAAPTVVAIALLVGPALRAWVRDNAVFTLRNGA